MARNKRYVIPTIIWLFYASAFGARRIALIWVLLVLFGLTGGAFFVPWATATDQWLAAFLAFAGLIAGVPGQIDIPKPRPYMVRAGVALYPIWMSFPARMSMPVAKGEGAAAVTVLYFKALQEKLRLPKMSLFACMSISALMLSLVRSSAVTSLVVCAATVAILYLKEHVSAFRIKRGYFGDTAAEARELIDFIVSHRINGNDGGDGGKRDISLPRVVSESEHSRNPSSVGVQA